MTRAPKLTRRIVGNASPAADANEGESVQIKVWLLGISPMVWRRVLVPSVYTLRQLHGVIQVAMGWEGIHLYQFCLRAARHGSWELSASSPEVALAALQLRKGARFTYEYDLNIPWRHENIGDSYLPFLRLGLVCYQEHAVDHLRLSHPIAFDVQLLPERRVWVEVRPGEGKRTVIVEGPGFEVPSFGQPAHKANAMHLALLSWNAANLEWRESRVIAERLDPELDRASRAYRWRHDFALPLSAYYPQSFVLVVEEFERLPIDEPTGHYHDGEAEFAEKDGERLSFSCLQSLVYPR